MIHHTSHRDIREFKVNWADGNESPGQIAALNEPQFSGISALLAANSGKNRLALKS